MEKSPRGNQIGFHPLPRPDCLPNFYNSRLDPNDAKRQSSRDSAREPANTRSGGIARFPQSVMKLKPATPLLALAACASLMPAAASAKGRPPHAPRPALCAPLKAWDSNGDRTVSPEEFAAAADAEVTKLQNRFLDKYDLDADDTVTTAEIRSVYGFVAADWLESVLDHFDTDGDGSITNADLKNRKRAPKGLATLIDEYDADADGELSAEELEAAADAQTADRVARLLVKYDADTDGNITSEEALVVHESLVDKKFDTLLDRFDLNGDGAVSAEEAVAAKRGHGLAGR